MPTLHLIDSDSTQACPAVLASLRAARSPRDAVLLLGGGPILHYARQAGIDDAEQLVAPFGKAALGVTMLRRWMRQRCGFDRIHCWSPGALHTAARLTGNTPKQLSLAHTPTHAQLRRLEKLCMSRHADNLHITADNPTLTRQIVHAGIPCQTAPLPLPQDITTTIHAEKRRALRQRWRVPREGDLAVAMLCDDPRLGCALDAATAVVLSCSTLTDAAGEPPLVSLILHPAQTNNRQARQLMRDQSQRMRVVQDAGVVRPWDVLGACDAALALGPNAGGLSLRWALHSGVPVIASRNGPAGDYAAAGGRLCLAPGASPRDLAHQLHEVLGKDVQCSMCNVQSESEI